MVIIKNLKSETEYYKNGQQVAQKSVLIAYLLWLFGGLFGLHHLYLRRDGQAFIWCCSFGGCFGLFWLLDMFYIPKYVKEYNDDHKFLHKLSKHELPSLSLRVVSVQAMAGFFLGQVCMLALTEDLKKYMEWCVPLAITFGVWLGGNIGRESGPWRLTGLITFLSYYCFYGENCDMKIIAAISTCVFTATARGYRRHQQYKCGLQVRFIRFGIGLAIYSCCWLMYLCLNAPMEYLPAFLQSQWWKSFTLALAEMWEYGNVYGFAKIFEYDCGFGFYGAANNALMTDGRVHAPIPKKLYFKPISDDYAALSSFLDSSAQFFFYSLGNTTLDEVLRQGQKSELAKMLDAGLDDYQDYFYFILQFFHEFLQDQYALLRAIKDYIFSGNWWISFKLAVKNVMTFGKTA